MPLVAADCVGVDMKPPHMLNMMKCTRQSALDTTTYVLHWLFTGAVCEAALCACWLMFLDLGQLDHRGLYGGTLHRPFKLI